MNEPHHTEPPESAAFQSEVLQQLAAAGSAGLAGSKLVVARNENLRAVQKRLLKALEDSGQIVAQEKGTSTRYWLAGQKPAEVKPEEKADEVLRRLLPDQRKGRLLTQSNIKSELLAGMGIPDSAVRTCLRILEQEQLLLKFTTGAKVFYAYAPAIRTMLGDDTSSVPPVGPTTEAAVSGPSTSPPTPGPRTTRPSEVPLPVTNQRVIEAYRSVRMQRRLPDVEIARLQEVMHCPVEELKVVVKRLCELGTFIPGKGDWSFATPAARAAAVMIQDEPHLFVRMKD